MWIQSARDKSHFLPLSCDSHNLEFFTQVLSPDTLLNQTDCLPKVFLPSSSSRTLYEHVDVPQDESLSGTWTVQESTGELLQAVTRGEVKKSWELRLLLCHRIASLGGGGREGEKWEAVLRDVRHQVRCQGLVKLIFTVRRYVQGLAKELEGVTEAGQ